ncbi:MAG: Stp1/IreP family PP2C-type Ser/Thr phosphatase [Lachnospiraceae bacterium]|nr:Stp1/IreP family PP2C-type Ser/Thr phosphatase [Lachnospiraceae bacterium]
MNNEDAFYVADHVGMFDTLMVVADGMGGHSFGEVASSLAVSTVVSYISREPVNMPFYIIEQAIANANLAVQKKAMELNSYGMGTTLVLAGVVGKHIYIANIGDSRLYTVEGRLNTIRQITKDHSYVEEMVELGLIERHSEAYESQKNVITRAIGIYSEVEADYFELDLMRDSYLLLCSDGLSNMVPDQVMKALILDENFPLEMRLDSLIEAANNRGGKDNITVILYAGEGTANVE